MNPVKFTCTVCEKLRNEKVFMIEEHDMLVCPKCKTSFLLPDKSPLGRYIDTWAKTAEDLWPLLRPELDQSYLANPRLFFLYEDCYYTLLIGRYNASIVLMGVFLEALMKERIQLKLNLDFRGTFGDCLSIIRNRKLMRSKDIYFLRRFKDEVRNPYQHADESQILEGVSVPVFPIQFEEGTFIQKLDRTLKNARLGRLKWKMVDVGTFPAFRSVVKQSLDREKAIYLFNQVYDFLLEAKIKYFKQEEYSEHFKKFGSTLRGI